MSLPVGFTTSEGVASGASAFVESDKDVMGILWERERGIPNKPTLVASIADDRRRFGGIMAGKFGAYVARNLFNNAGSYGARVYGCRVIGITSQVAAAAATYSSANTQAWTTRQLVAHSATQRAKSAYYPILPEVGDTFTINSVDFVATEASPTSVCAGITAALLANATFTGTYNITNRGDYIEIEHKTLNTALAITATATNGSQSNTALCTFKAGQEGQEDPGTWANGMEITLYPFGVRGAGVCGLTIKYKNEVVGDYTGRTFQAIVNQVNSESLYLVIQNYATGHFPATQSTFVLAGGTYVAPATEADFYPVSGASPKGLACFDGYNVQILACAEYHTATMALQLREYAYLTRRTAICFLPQFANASAHQSFSQALQTADERGSYIAAYNMWVRTSDEAGSYTWVPGMGWVLGAGFVRKVKMEGDKIWSAPAGMETSVADAVEVAPSNLSDAEVDLYVKSYTINCAVFQRGVGYHIVSSRTMSTNSLFHSIHNRRLTNYLMESLKTTFRWVLQKPNTPETIISIKTQMVAIFKVLYDAGALEQTIDFKDNVKVVVDLSNNPRTQNRKELNIEVYWIPAECIESVGLRLLRNDGVLVSMLLNEAIAA